MSCFLRLSLLMLMLAVPASATTGRVARRGGILGQQAPRLEVSQWVNLPAGKKSVDVTDYQGQVRVLFFFQSW